MNKSVRYILLAVAAAVLLASPRLRFWPTPWPPTVWQPFSSWGDGWVLSPRSSGWYMIYLAYHKQDGGRVDSETRRTDLKLTVTDETNGEPVPLHRDWEYADIGPNKDWQMEQVANVRLVEGHRYRIEIDGNQLEYLARYRHKLGVDIDVSEKRNWAKRNKRMRF